MWMVPSLAHNRKLQLEQPPLLTRVMLHGLPMMLMSVCLLSTQFLKNLFSMFRDTLLVKYGYHLNALMHPFPPLMNLLSKANCCESP
ncbi:hypothetical protein Hanom_Chr10g00875561 [Helianthus anomalus]